MSVFTIMIVIVLAVSYATNHFDTGAHTPHSNSLIVESDRLDQKNVENGDDSDPVLLFSNMWNIDNDQTESLMASFLPDHVGYELLPSNEFELPNPNQQLPQFDHMISPAATVLPHNPFPSTKELHSSKKQLDDFDNWFGSLFNDEFSTPISFEDEGGMNSQISSETTPTDLNTAVQPPAVNKIVIKKNILKKSEVPKQRNQAMIAAVSSDIHQVTAPAPRRRGKRSAYKEKKQRFKLLDSKLHIDDKDIRTYDDLCKFLGKPPNDSERKVLERKHVDASMLEPADLITLCVDGHEIKLEDYCKLSTTGMTLPKLILIANLYRQLRPIMDKLNKTHGQRTKLKGLYYMVCRPIIYCVSQCCGDNLLEFHQRWADKRTNRFRHSDFGAFCCPGRGKAGTTQCGWKGKSILDMH